MRSKIALFIILSALSFSPVAHAQDASAVISRMDTIIKQMEALKTEFAELVASIGKPSGAVLGSQSSSKSVFTMSLDQGQTNDDIKKIQKLLATDPEIYPYGVASGFFGPKTEEAIRNFQTRFGLDPVGVVGPATKALLELFMNAYPDGSYPSDVLKKKPQVAGASASVPMPSTPVIPSVSSNTNSIDEITAKYDGDEARIKVYYSNDETETHLIEEDSKIKVVDALAAKLGKTRAQILSVIEFTSSNDDDEDEDDDDDDDFDVDVEVDDDEVTVFFEYDDDDYEVEVDSTDEDDVIEEVADELDEDEDDLDDDLVDAIEDALEDALEDEDEDDGEDDEIDSISADVANGEAQIEVEYGDGEEEEFTVEETLEAEIIEEVADELNVDEDEVEDIIEFNYEDIEEISVDTEKRLAFVEFEDGTEKRVHLDSEDEDEIIQQLADELDEDEDDIEEWTEFD